MSIFEALQLTLLCLSRNWILYNIEFLPDDDQGCYMVTVAKDVQFVHFPTFDGFDRTIAILEAYERDLVLDRS